MTPLQWFIFGVALWCGWESWLMRRERLARRAADLLRAEQWDRVMRHLRLPSGTPAPPPKKYGPSPLNQ